MLVRFELFGINDYIADYHKASIWSVPKLMTNVKIHE